MNKKEKIFSLVDQWRRTGLIHIFFAHWHGITDSSLKYQCRKRDNKVRQGEILLRDFVKFSPSKN